MILQLISNPDELDPVVELTAFGTTTGTPSNPYTLVGDGSKYSVNIPETLTGEWYVVAKNSDEEIFFAGFWYAGEDNRCYDYARRIETDLSGINQKLDAIKGPGDTSFSLVINNDAGVPIAHCSCWVATDINGVTVITDRWETDESGRVEFLLDPGTYYLFRQKNGTTFSNNPLEFTVA